MPVTEKSASSSLQSAKKAKYQNNFATSTKSLDVQNPIAYSLVNALRPLVTILENDWRHYVRKYPNGFIEETRFRNMNAWLMMESRDLPSDWFSSFFDEMWSGSACRHDWWWNHGIFPVIDPCVFGYHVEFDPKTTYVRSSALNHPFMSMSWGALLKLLYHPCIQESKTLILEK